MPTENVTASRRHAADERVQITNLSKSFPGTRALDSVNLTIGAGEIHALVGGNGSGKSTLIKILCGVYQGDPDGSIRIDAHVTASDETSPAGARESGVHAVHQDLGVFLDMSVAENLALGSGYERTWLGGIDWRSLNKRTRSLIERFEIAADPNTQLRAVGPSVRTQVAIARALQGQSDSSSGLLILDEPTASLPAHEVALLLSQLKKYAAAGQAILYVSHRLDEILAIADRVTALRDGRVVGTYTAAEISEDFLIELIVGSVVEKAPRVSATSRVDVPLFSATDIAAAPLRNVTLDVRPGEVVGLAGLLGSGRSELLRTIFGDLRPSAGHMRLNGRPFAPRSTAEAIKSGVAYVPENRLHDGVFLDETIASNIAMPALASYFRRGRLSNRAIRADATSDIQKFLVKATGADALLSTLSGGNQQKVVVARWLRLRPTLLLLDEPTQGVDVGARAEIYDLVRAATDNGAAALVAASDFEELISFCDRILVIREGRIVAQLTGDEMTPQRLTHIVLETSETSK
ncbi:sugar ABC transporter ATP-binding protein [Subtercola frigoramans]|uniref:Ribose transport system ATP-binding protein n=1 Tax=Subtercola frigoramans TaxID=120298 RepID=A0ABS2L713_9MICO|nr:ribose transport system ATP-binding protein [Subtercola frigoramans]